MTFPIQGKFKLTQGFGLNPDIYGPAYKGHMGYDYGYNLGTITGNPYYKSIVVRERLNGQYNNGWGNHVWLLTNSEYVDKNLSPSIYVLTDFNHALENPKLVKEGQILSEKEPVIAGNSSGFSSGNHLHWGERHFEKDDTGTWDLLGVKYRLLNADNGYKGFVDFKPHERFASEKIDVLPVDERYGQTRSIVRELLWKTKNERYAKEQALKFGIPYNDRIMNAFTYGYWNDWIVYNSGWYATWTMMHKPEFEKRFGSVNKYK